MEPSHLSAQARVTKYSRRTVWIHWTTALLILMMIATGLKMEHATVSPQKILLYRLHFSSGMLVFVLTIWRVVALWKDVRPQDLYQKGSIHHYLVKSVQYGFYAVLIWMCVSGMLSVWLEGILPAMSSGNPRDLPKLKIIKGGFLWSHHKVAKLVMLLLVLHVSGYLLHLVRFRENTLKRIWK